MSNFNWRMGHGRGSKNLVSGTVPRMDSSDGKRRASGRYVKVSVGPGRYDATLSFTFREKINGKWKVVDSGYNEEAAKRYIETGSPYEGWRN